MTPRLLITALLVAQAVAQAAWAGPQEPMLYYRDGARVDPVEVSRILAGPVRTRSIRLLPETPRDEASAVEALLPPGRTNGGGGKAAASPVVSGSVEPAPLPAQPQSIALPVQFAFDSAEILPRARAQLDAVAEGIKLLPEASRVLIEGHTDALGTHQYNLQLSRKRAEAVKHYLVTEHGLDAQRLKTVGYGEARPVDGEDASKPENRRVQFRGA